MVHHAIRDVPRLTVPKRLRRPPPKHDPRKEYQFRYRAKKHSSLPHVVKFSGGRSSGMLLFALLENGLLDASRGDVIVFNNTSAEHPVVDLANRLAGAGCPVVLKKLEETDLRTTPLDRALELARSLQDHVRSDD